MSSPQDVNKPKYMCLQGKTQFEMAQAIDQAMAQAEQADAQDAQQVALQLWYEQLEQQIQEELNISQDALPQGDVNTRERFVKLSGELRHQLHMGTNPQTGFNTDHQFLVLLKLSLTQCIDMLRARNLWRFDLQRTLEGIQGQLINEWQRKR